VVLYAEETRSSMNSRSTSFSSAQSSVSIVLKIQPDMPSSSPPYVEEILSEQKTEKEVDLNQLKRHET
jgi:hypothetical protein